MPYLEAKRIPVWITTCEALLLDASYTLTTEEDENCIIQLIDSKCTVQYKQQSYPLAARSVIFLGRHTTICFDGGSQPCEVLILRYQHAHSRPNLDLNHMCLTISMVDFFLGSKKRFCLLSDHEQIYMTLNAIRYEFEHTELERDNMLYSLLYEMFIKLARSYHERSQSTGIRYLSRVRSFVQQNYQNDINLDEIAAYAGISRSYLTMLFSRHMKRTVVDYIQAVRCDHAAYLLSTTNFAVIDIAVETGFNNRQHFARTFAKLYGLPPSRYRQTYQISPSIKNAAGR